MAIPGPSRRAPWAWCRRSFRIARITLLASILLLLVALTWLRLFGLPNFLRIQLVDELARRGVVAHFRSLHFHWFRGLVAEDLRVAWGGTNNPGIRFQIAEADLDVAPPLAWRNRSSLLRGLSIRRGSLSIPLLLTNEPPVDLQLDNISAQIRFRPGDHWEIPRLAARLEGVQFELSAQITNTTALRRPRPKPVPAPADPAAKERSLRLIRNFVQELRTWTEASSAKLAVHLDIDGDQLYATHGDLFLEVPSASTLHGDLLGLRLSARVQPSIATNLPSQGSVILELGELRTPRGGVSQFFARAQLTGTAAPILLTNATWEARVAHAFTRGFQARNATLTGTTRIPASPNLRDALLDTTLNGNANRLEIGRGPLDPLAVEDPGFNLHLLATPSLQAPRQIDGTLSTRSITDALGDTGPARIQFDLASRSPSPEPPPPHLGAWTNAWPLTGQLEVELAEVRAKGLAIERLKTVLHWEAPRLALRKLEASLYRGELQTRGDLDVVSRLATVTALSTFDLHGIDPILGPRSLENFRRYQWTLPPWAEAQAHLTLPPWDAPKVDWAASVKPTVRVDARLKVGPGSYKGMPFDDAVTSLSFDGTTWRLPDIRTTRPEGRQEVAVEYNEDTREYHVQGRGRVLPPVLKPVLGEQSAVLVDLFEFTHGVDAEVSVWGPWTEGTRQAILGTIVATNFHFRAQRFDRLEADVSYTNRFLVASPVRLTRDAGETTAEGVGYDFADDRLWLTNAITTIEPAVVAAAISPSFPEKIAHYQFAMPPRIRANGTLRPRETDSADVAFSIQGGPFAFWRLKTETIETDLLWKGSTLTLTNLTARFFDGTLAGHAFFDLENPDDSPYRFEAQIRQAELGDLLRHASGGPTNVAAGSIDLDLTITSARTADLYSWNGSGRAILRDGSLWDVPIFGFASPLLNAIVPGLGINRAKAAEATFTLTNSLIHTRDLTIDCPPAKLFYRGTVDFDQNVNAKVEAQVLGNFTPMGPLFGLLLRPLTKLFEFRTTGTLSNVEVEPLYIPKFLLLPLQPLRYLRDLIGGDPQSRHRTPDTQPEIPVTQTPPPPVPVPKPNGSP